MDIPTLVTRATICKKNCGLLPGGTRFLEIWVPDYLHLHLVKTGGRLKILYIDLPSD